MYVLRYNCSVCYRSVSEVEFKGIFVVIHMYVHVGV